MEWPVKIRLRRTKVMTDSGREILSTADGMGYEKQEYLLATAANAEIARLTAALEEIESQELPLTEYAGNYVREIVTAALQGEECNHHWVDATNKVVQSGEICTKCCAVRAAPQGEGK